MVIFALIKNLKLIILASINFHCSIKTFTMTMINDLPNQLSHYRHIFTSLDYLLQRQLFLLGRFLQAASVEKRIIYSNVQAIRKLINLIASSLFAIAVIIALKILIRKLGNIWKKISINNSVRTAPCDWRFGN